MGRYLLQRKLAVEKGVDLARRCGMSAPAISQLANGRRLDPTRRHALALAAHAGIGPETWDDFGDTDDPRFVSRALLCPSKAPIGHNEIEGDDTMSKRVLLDALSRVLGSPIASDAEKAEARRMINEELARSEGTTARTSAAQPTGRVREKDEIDRLMGVRAPITKTHEVLPDGRLIIHAIRPSDWRRIEDQEQRRAATGPHRFGRSTPIGDR